MSITTSRHDTIPLGSRMRSVKTDFVSCPSCGRTLFDLQEVTEQIKKKTGHLPGVAIAIMVSHRWQTMLKAHVWDVAWSWQLTWLTWIVSHTSTNFVKCLCLIIIFMYPMPLSRDTSLDPKGCIVNGPGEMADADFGYVGGAPGKVDLYVGKDVVKRAIPNELACDALVQLIKDNNRCVCRVNMWSVKHARFSRAA